MTENKQPASRKYIYWITTWVIAIFVLPGVFFINSEMAQEGMKHIQAPVRLWHLVWYGQPLWVLIILLPRFSKSLKERAYIALGIVYISAFYAHIVIDGITNSMTYMALIVLIILVVSYIYWHKITDSK